MAHTVQLVVKQSDCGDSALCYMSHTSGLDVLLPLPDKLVHRCAVLRNMLDHEGGCTALPITSSAFECWVTGVGTLIEHCQACNVRIPCLYVNISSLGRQPDAYSQLRTLHTK